MKRIVTFFGLGIVAFVAGCTEPAKPTPPPPPKPAPVVEAPKPTDAGAADAHLGMMERHAIWLAKKQADEKLAKELAEAEEARLRKFDKTKLSTHVALPTSNARPSRPRPRFCVRWIPRAATRTSARITT